MIIRRISLRSLPVLAAAVASASLAGVGNAQKPMTATALMVDTSGHKLGTIKFTHTKDGLTIKGSVSGLPAGTHGIHLHPIGKCDPPDFLGAGVIFNPTNMQYGLNNPKGPELGDLQNIRIVADHDAAATIAPKGSGSINLTAKGMTLTGTNALIGPNGAALVIDDFPDDYKTPPDGKSGARIACGVITLESSGGR